MTKVSLEAKITNLKLTVDEYRNLLKTRESLKDFDPPDGIDLQDILDLETKIQSESSEIREDLKQPGRDPQSMKRAQGLLAEIDALLAENPKSRQITRKSA
jgi:hypothetical protein